MRSRRDPWWLGGLALCAACGSRSSPSLEVEQSAGENVHTPGAPPPPLELAWGPKPVLEDSDLNGFARAVVRSSGFDLLFRPELSSSAMKARRATLARNPLRLELSRRVAALATGNSLAIAVSGDLLALCHSRYNAEPIRFSAYRGDYEATASDRLLYDSGLGCDGLAFSGERGLLAVTKEKPGGSCCVRAALSELTTSGALQGQEQPVFPDGESARVTLAAHAGRFVWAGYVEDPGALRVSFGPGTVAERHVDVLGDIHADTRPRLAGWPFSRGASVSWQETPQLARVVSLEEDGTRHLDLAIAGPNGELVSRPELAATPNGLVVAYTLCPSYAAEPGQLRVELFGRGGEQRGEPIHLTVDCHTYAASAEALGDVALILWPRKEVVTQGALSGPQTTGFLGVLVQANPDE